VSVHLTFRPAGSAIEAACRFGLAVTGGTTEMTEEQVRPATLAQWQHELRLVGSDTLIGTWTLPRLTPELFRPLERFLEGSRDRFTCYFVITRT
jgi:hypothetical protein